MRSALAARLLMAAGIVLGCLLMGGTMARRADASGLGTLQVLGCGQPFTCNELCVGDAYNGFCAPNQGNTLCKYTADCNGCLHAIGDCQ